MAKRLREYINSDYFNAANKMRAKAARKRIAAYVESYDDVYFWRMVLSEFENDKRYFEVMLPSKINLSKGKKQVLMNLISSQVGEAMIACVDADYDYLMQGVTETSKKVISNPYVFHTYVYAIENYQCYAPSLHDVCVMTTLNDHLIFDFEEYLRLYSQAIFPLFVWSIWYYRRPNYGEFSISDFCKVIETGHFTIANAYSGIANVRHKVGRKVMQLQRNNPDAKETYLALKDELKKLGVTPDTTYLYIQGHHLNDNVVMPMLNKVCERLRRERETEIHSKAVHNTQMRNELSSYQHSVENLASMLKKNTGYVRSPQYLRLKTDIRRFLKRLDKKSQPYDPPTPETDIQQPAATLSNKGGAAHSKIPSTTSSPSHGNPENRVD